jgi:hypothetical protein
LGWWLKHTISRPFNHLPSSLSGFAFETILFTPLCAFCAMIRSWMETLLVEEFVAVVFDRMADGSAAFCANGPASEDSGITWGNAAVAQSICS